MEYVLFCGTALGLFRDGGVPPGGDDDVDLAVSTQDLAAVQQQKHNNPTDDSGKPADAAKGIRNMSSVPSSPMHVQFSNSRSIFPFTSLFLDDIIDKPGPCHIFTEQPQLKWTWDEQYDDAYEKPSGAE